MPVSAVESDYTPAEPFYGAGTGERRETSCPHKTAAERRGSAPPTISGAIGAPTKR